MKKVLQLVIQCLGCETRIVIAELPWNISQQEEFTKYPPKFQCYNCYQSTWQVYTQLALIPIPRSIENEKTTDSPRK